jgi:Complex1_LYR-like
LGDRYVKAEFHRTKDTDNPVHIIGFLSQWQVCTITIMCLQEEYCQAVEGEHWKDGKVDMNLIEKLSDEQVGQVNFGF